MKYIVSILFSLILLYAGVVVSAEEYEFSSSEQSGFQENENDYGQNEILDSLPQEAKSKLEQEGISPENQGALKLSFGDVLNKVWNLFLENIKKPLKFLVSAIAIALLYSIANSMNVDKGNNLSQTFGIVSVLAGAGILIQAVGECVTDISEALSQGANFMLAFIPVFAGFLASSGQLTTAGVFNGVFLGASQVFMQIGVNLLLPLASTILGISIAGAVNPDIKIESIAKTIKIAVTWILGLLMTIFIGLLSVQSLVANSADSVVLKTAKFAVSSGVPIVGGSVAEAVGAVYSSVSLIKNSVGTFGIIAGIVIIAPTFFAAFSYKIAVMASSGICDLFGANQLSSMMKSAGEVLTIVIAVLVCFMVLSVISIGFMLMLGAGAVV